MNQHLDITISGKVQGVFFRIATKAVADQLGIKGLVKNLPDGDVFCEAEGDKQSIEMFLEWLNEGPEHAKVTGVTTNMAELKNYRNFDVVKK